MVKNEVRSVKNGRKCETKMILVFYPFRLLSTIFIQGLYEIGAFFRKIVCFGKTVLMAYVINFTETNNIPGKCSHCIQCLRGRFQLLWLKIAKKTLKRAKNLGDSIEVGLTPPWKFCKNMYDV